MKNMDGASPSPERRTAPAPRVSLSVQYAAGGGGLPTRHQFRRWVKAAALRELAVTLRLVEETEGRELNRGYRGKDWATNVLTFVYDDLDPLAGDIVLCAPVVAREAREQGKPLEAHYAHLTVHGTLHLQGYDHEREEEAARMEGLESRIVTGLGYAEPYAQGV